MATEFEEGGFGAAASGSNGNGSGYDDYQPAEVDPELDLSPADVLAKMAAEDTDPIPTGFAPLDNRLRRGGLPMRRILSIGGPPFAGKTTIVVDILLTLSKRLPVFALFSDEGREQAAVRMAVMSGLELESVEHDPAKAGVVMRERLAEHSLTLRKPDHFCSNVATLFDDVREKLGPGIPAIVALDSVQTIPAQPKNNQDQRLAYESFMRVTRAKVQEYGYTAIITSQSNRQSYRSRKSEDNSRAIASFSGTAMVEFLSDVAIVLDVPDPTTEIVPVEMVKNRLVAMRNRLPKKFSIKYDSQLGRMVEVDEVVAEEQKATASAQSQAAKKQAGEHSHQLAIANIQESIVRRLRTGPAGRLTTQQLRTLIGGKYENFQEALRGLEATGQVDYTTGKSGAFLWGMRSGGVA